MSSLTLNKLMTQDNMIINERQKPLLLPPINKQISNSNRRASSATCKKSKNICPLKL